MSAQPVIAIINATDWSYISITSEKSPKYILAATKKKKEGRFLSKTSHFYTLYLPSCSSLLQAL